MSIRARAYLLIAGVRALATAIVLMLLGGERADHLYPYVMNPLPPLLWVAIWMGIGLFILAATLRGSETLGLIGLVAIASTTAIWAMGVTLSFFDSPQYATLSALLWWALVAKDFIQAREPMSSPFESLLKAYSKTYGA